MTAIFDRKTATPIPPISPVGIEGYRRANGYIFEEFHPKLRGQRAIRIYREMSDNSPIVGALLLLLEMLIRQAEQRVDVAKENEGIGEAMFYRDFVEQCLDDMRTTRSAFLSDVCSEFWAGFAYFETTYKLRRGPSGPEWARSRHDDGLIGWGDHQIRAQETIWRWEFDKNQLVGAWQEPWNLGGRIYLPLDGFADDGSPVQCLHFKTRHARGNPLGKSLLRNAYRSYWHAARLEDLEGIGAWKDMAGVLTQSVPHEWLSDQATTDQQDAVENFRKFVERAGRGEYEGLVVPCDVDTNSNPTGFKTWLMQQAGRKPMDLDPIVRRHESRIAVSMLGEVVLLGTGGAGASGSWALSSSKTSMLSRGVRGLMTGIEDTLNRVAVPRLMAWNGWDPRLSPVFRFGDVESDEGIELLGAIATAASAGVLAPGPALERSVRERYGLPLEEEPEPGALRPRPPTQAPLVGAVGEVGADGGAPAGGNIQQQALNGAQVASLIEIVQSVQAGTLPRDTAIQIVMMSFQLDASAAERLLAGAGSQAAAPAPTAPAEKDTEDDDTLEEELASAMSVEAAASYLGVTPGRINAALRRGQLPGAKVGSTWRVMRGDLDAYMRGGAK